MNSAINIEMMQAEASMNLLSTTIGEWAISHGFREDWDLAEWLDKYADGYSEDTITYQRMKETAEALRTNILGMKLMLTVSELAEALESLRKVGATGVLKGEGNYGEEIADAQIRLFDQAHLINPQNKIKTVAREVIEKIKINATRPYKHGKKC